MACQLVYLRTGPVALSSFTYRIIKPEKLVSSLTERANAELIFCGMQANLNINFSARSARAALLHAVGLKVLPRFLVEREFTLENNVFLATFQCMLRVHICLGFIRMLKHRLYAPVYQ